MLTTVNLSLILYPDYQCTYDSFCEVWKIGNRFIFLVLITHNIWSTIYLMSSLQKPLRVIVIRDGQKAQMSLIPQRWSGRGLLGWVQQMPCLRSQNTSRMHWMTTCDWISQNTFRQGENSPNVVRVTYWIYISSLCLTAKQPANNSSLTNTLFEMQITLIKNVRG